MVRGYLAAIPTDRMRFFRDLSIDNLIGPNCNKTLSRKVWTSLPQRLLRGFHFTKFGTTSYNPLELQQENLDTTSKHPCSRGQCHILNKHNIITSQGETGKGKEMEEGYWSRMAGNMGNVSDYMDEERGRVRARRAVLDDMGSNGHAKTMVEC